MTLRPNFWKGKSLEKFSTEEWEALCDGCGQCCLYKLEDEDSGDILLTNVVCRFLDQQTCQCQVYAQRHQEVPTCVQLTPQNVLELKWIPLTCAYKLVAESKPLPKWHPLISGDRQSIQETEFSIDGRIISESEVDMDDLENYVIS